MPVVHLVRHGQASFGAETAHGYDVLSDLGRRQAEVAGAELARRAPRDPLVVCGTLNRQRDTAELLVKAAGLTGTPRTDPRWNEYDHIDLVRRYGAASQDASGAPADNRGAQRVLDRALAAWMADTDEGGWERFATGAFDALRGLVAELGPGRDAVVVTSGGVLAALCGRLLSAPPAGIVALNRVVVNAAITTVVAGSAGVSLLSFNDHAHFVGDRRPLLTYR
ncbi:histidine phosphatase family protein [Streptomyces sp. TRM43335]|uniref:Histidine phosphatase family protein n=1 Tax=Streptomyces taklimakanensis TaxID=2569853 RepID=A0A6G2BIW1_9ACTN|nr:histidine phosphatase family protein [Streptomyces taklimakanensis]MTE22009.1 histidine phosphatase family protein [Streptomyces taklimakanensis]